uniref:Putative ovule protein n=1 Tax=Solanum chacoense TaxID=4108 RepID=A0A0V0GIV0_SOLCH
MSESQYLNRVKTNMLVLTWLFILVQIECQPSDAKQSTYPEVEFLLHQSSNLTNLFNYSLPEGEKRRLHFIGTLLNLLLVMELCYRIFTV